MFTTASAMHGAVRSRPYEDVKTCLGVSGCFRLPKVSQIANRIRKKKPMQRGAMTWASCDENTVVHTIPISTGSAPAVNRNAPGTDH